MSGRRGATRTAFWSSLVLIGYTYVGAPLLVGARALLAPKPVRAGQCTPAASIIVAAHNEAEVIAQKIENSLALDYPPHRLEVIVASDGSTDGTDAVVEALDLPPNVTLLTLPRGGKNMALNAALEVAVGEVVVFTDADTMLEPGALRHLMAPFSDPEVGGVSGDYRHATQLGETEGQRAYWSFERLHKRWQSRGGTLTSAAGGVYAMRHGLTERLPASVNDDFSLSVLVPASGSRLVFAPRAVGVGPVGAGIDAEFRRKVRTMSRGFRGVWRVRRCFNPLRHGFFAVQLVSHKLLRRLMAVPMLVLGLAAAGAWRDGRAYRVAAVLSGTVWAAGVAGWLARGTPAGRRKPLALPAYFAMVNLASLAAVGNLARGRRYDVWTPERTDARAQGPAARPAA